MRAVAFALPLILTVGACNDREPEPTPTPTPTMAAPRTLVGADLDLSTLGARIQGPQGPDVETVLSAGNREIGRMVSYVACPEGVLTCVPGELPDGTIYTYVHQVTLSDAQAINEDQSGKGPEVIETPPTLFRMTRPATGFNQAVGFSTAQAEEALGDPDAISISLDNGSLIWRVARGSGWKPGSTMTFWWQSTEPPAGPESAYLLEVEGNQAEGSGPFPADRNPAPDGMGN